MTLYARYTAFRYDPAIEEQLTKTWAEATGDAITRQPGFISAQQQSSVEQPGYRHSITTWRSKEDFDNWYRGPVHGALNQVFADLQVEITQRDGSEVISRLTPQVGQVRVVRSKIKDVSRIPELEQFWRDELAPILRAQPGLRHVEAAISEAESLFVLILHWESQEVADEFVCSDEHEELTSKPLRNWTNKLGRDDLRPLG